MILLFCLFLVSFSLSFFLSCCFSFHASCLRCHADTNITILLATRLAFLLLLAEIYMKMKEIVVLT